MNIDDQTLINYVQQQINSGKTRIIIPGYLIRNANGEALVEIKRLCKLNGVEIEISQ